MRIDIDQLSKSFGSVQALRDLSMTLEPGNTIAVLGPNGAGKTTLLHCLAGILVPTTGKILIDGEPFRRDLLVHRKRFFFIPDTPIVPTDWTVVKYLGLVLRLYEVNWEGMDDKVVQLLEEFELLPKVDAKLGELSRGELYKANLVAFLAADPELWMFDEPFASGMDPGGITSLKRAMLQAASRGRIVLYSTQILDIVESFSDRACILHRGKLHAFGAIPSLRGPENLPSVGLEEIFEQLREKQP